MANLILAVGNWASTNGLWGKIIGLFYNLIQNMGWTIVVVTVLLKLLLIPLDIYQKNITAKSTLKQEEMKPDLEKVQRLYGNNPEMLNKKTMEVYKNHNFSMGSTCFGMLINLVLTMFIFITLFNALRGISTSLIKDEYEVLRTTYVGQYNEYMASTEYQTDYDNYLIEFDALTDKGELTRETYAQNKTNEKAVSLSQTAVYNKYQEIKESWLWIKNVYLTDTAVNPFPSFDNFVKNSGITFDETYVSLSNETFTDASVAKEAAKADYELMNGKIIASVDKKWNGYYILIILSGLVTFLSTKITKIGQPKQTQKVRLPDGTYQEKEVDPMGMMSWLLPAMMVFFTLSYTGMFAIYIVVNSLVSIIISLATVYIKKFIKLRKKATNVSIKNTIEDYNTNDYRRYDKYTIIDDGSSKNKK